MSYEQVVQGMGIEHIGTKFHHYPQNYTLEKQEKN